MGSLETLGYESLVEFGERTVEGFLQENHLGVKDIESQTLPELQRSLDTVDHWVKSLTSDEADQLQPASRAPELLTSGLLEHPVFKKMQPSVTRFYVSILLERKSLILQRITALEAQNQQSTVREAAEALVTDPTTRGQLMRIIEESAQASTRVAARNMEVVNTQREADKIQLDLKNQQLIIELERERAAIEEMKKKSWFKFATSVLRRESMASLIGAFLLLVLGVSLTVSMFTHTSTTDIVGNSFLLILGYFFGQAADRTGARRG